ncbi:MAG: right-handed parallel beta-helix repeat-containing protein, partial [Verrucomicrobiota bacterium]|nr:right-handed parallel beta-helix repeat-containing protein [Verrucomicrobiota bacterium]
MTTTQKILIATTAAVLVGTSVYEAMQISDLRNQVQQLHQQQKPLTDENAQLRRERDDAVKRLAMLQQDNERLHRDTAEIFKLRGDVTRLQKEENPFPTKYEGVFVIEPDCHRCYIPAVNFVSRIFIGTILFFALITAQGATFHVAPNGDDKNSGSFKKPFASLVRARDAVRKLKSKKLRAPITILVHGGTYQQSASFKLTAEDSGTSKNPIVWQAAPGAEVRLTGGPVLPASAFRPITDEKVLARLDSGARGKILQLNLRDFSRAEIPEFAEKFRGAPESPELFFQDQRMTLARWPNKGWATISKIIESGSVSREGDNSNRPGIFEYNDARPDRWNAERGVWLQGYWCYDWHEETIKVKSIERNQHRITLAAPALYGIKQGNPSPRRFRAMNILEELDEPGEFYIDRVAGVLYFWPPSPLENSRVTLSLLNAPLLVLTNVEHVTFRGFTVEASLGNGIEIFSGRSNRIENCVVRNTRQLGIRVIGGTGHVVERCEIHDTGTGGLVLEGGDRKTLTPAHHEALNNHIWQFSRHQFTAAYGLTLGGVGNRAAHNVLHDAPHQAVFLNGNDHIFEFNIVSNVVMETDDAGALYKGRNPSCRGNIIRYNFWKDIGSSMGHGTAAIYFDDGDGGDLVFGNIFLRCGHPGEGVFATIFSHGGHDIRAENNIFIDCLR